MSISVGASFGKDYFLRTYYGTNRDARTNTKREGMSSNTKSVADSYALKKAVEDLKDVDYENTEKDGELYNKFLAFVSAYNNTMESSNESDSRDVKHAQKMMKKITSKYADELEDLGVSINKDGSLKLSDNVGDKFTIEKMKKIFSPKETSYAKDLKRYSAAMYTQAYNISKMSKDGIDASV